MSTLTAIARNTGVLLGGTAASKLLVFASYLILTRLLGPVDFGRYTLVFTYLIFLEIAAGAGLETLAIREQNQSPEKARDWLGSAYLLRGLILLIGIPVALVAYFQFGLQAGFYYALVGYGIIQFLDGNVLVPLLFSEVVDLHPVAIITAILFFGGIWGFWGVFFAIPLATAIQAILRAWPSAAGPPAEAAPSA